MLLNNLRDKTRCLRFMALGQGPPQQLYLMQAVPPEAITVNNSWNNKIKETKRIRKSQASIVPGVANHQQTKLLGLNQTTTTIAAKTSKK